MKHKFIFCTLFLCFPLSGISQSSLPKGYPSVEGNIDIRTHFTNPPQGYGNVPFYWWNGDSLKEERLLEQLEILSEAATDGFSVSYIHTHPEIDKEINANGFGSFGRADAGAPEVFSKEWWNIWSWFSGKCAEKGLGLGLDDYVIGWADNGYYVDELRADKQFSNYQGRLQIKTYTIAPHAVLEAEMPEHLVSVTAYPSQKTLEKHIKGNKLTWKSDCKETQQVYVIYSEASYELHPEYGKRLVNAYFNRFEQRMDENGRKGMNYFFQDELHYNLNIHSWCEDMPEEFKQRKGYDVRPYLPALFENIGTITPKIRLDYAEVVTQLAEERYFKPVFDWHNERGLIYGCDNNGRGLEPLQYLDYFRATSWYTAPGNDAPARGSSFRQTKVSSSVSHLYQRPRTWLEAFHSMGWDSNGEWLTTQLDHHMIAGGNLLCLHGLYYSTHGGWWEWAPPCFHFRMPYWPHMKHWLEYAERLSFLLSQGKHICDIAVLYPTESMQAYPEANANTMWKLTDYLSNTGLDYDYIDFQSLQHAAIENACLSAGNEKYKILLLADIKALHHETLLKIRDFSRKGGIVIATGELPKATSRSGENDTEMQNILQEIFQNKEKSIIEQDILKIPEIIRGLITPDFQASTGETGKVLHRKIGQNDVYMTMDIKNGTEIFFRTHGKVECWNATDGSMHEQPILRQSEEGTWIKYDGPDNASRLFVFSPGTPVYAQATATSLQPCRNIPIEGEWETEIIPTMNNKWGDFRLPASDEFIGVEAREFSYTFIPDEQKQNMPPTFSADSMKGIYGYAPYMTTITLDKSERLEDFLQKDFRTDNWQPYCWSWQYGVFDNPGSQGYHGLKGKTDNRFIILDQGGHQVFRTFVYAPKNGAYRIEKEGTLPDFLLIDRKNTKDKNISLTEGWHEVIIAYANTSKETFVLSDNKSNNIDRRKRSAVVFYPAESSVPQERHSYDQIIAMKWYNTNFLPYNIQAEREGIWAYQFETAPGAKTLDIRLKGELQQVWIDGKETIPASRVQKSDSWQYILQIPETTASISTVVLTARPEKGYSGPALFTEPVRIACGKGKMTTGNWSNFGAMKFFSGGVRYKKQIDITEDISARKAELDLGMVDATCEVKINGSQPIILMSPPYKLDITPYIKKGENQIEVLAYSTLSNHYQTIPSAYRGTPRSGIIGPIKLIYYK